MIDINRQTHLFRQLHHHFHRGPNPQPFWLPVYVGEDPDRIAAMLQGLGYSVRVHSRLAPGTKTQNLFCANEAQRALLSGQHHTCTLEVRVDQPGVYV